MNSGNLIFNICMSKVHCALPGDFKLKVNMGPTPVPECPPEGRGPAKAPTVCPVCRRKRPHRLPGQEAVVWTAWCSRGQVRPARARSSGRLPAPGPPDGQGLGAGIARTCNAPTPAHSHRSGAHGSRETVGPRICGDTSTLSGSWGPQGQPPAPVLCSCTALGRQTRRRTQGGRELCILS